MKPIFKVFLLISMMLSSNIYITADEIAPDQVKNKVIPEENCVISEGEQDPMTATPDLEKEEKYHPMPGVFESLGNFFSSLWHGIVNICVAIKNSILKLFGK